MPAPDWSSGLPPELLRCVALLLDFFPDLASFSCTCSSWRSSALGLVDDDGATSLYALRRRTNPPLLIPLHTAAAIDSGGGSSSSSSISLFYSPFHGRAFEFRLPDDEILEWCPSSSTACAGWLMLVDGEHDPLDSEIVLLHPFSMELSLRLPPLRSFIAALQEEQNAELVDGARFLVNTAVVVSDPASMERHIVLAAVGPNKTLALCRAGDAEWTAVRNSGNMEFDSLVVSGFGGRRLICALETWDVVLAYDVESDAAEAMVRHPDWPLFHLDGGKVLLAESFEGELLLVVKMCPGGRCPYASPCSGWIRR